MNEPSPPGSTGPSQVGGGRPERPRRRGGPARGMTAAGGWRDPCRPEPGWDAADAARRPRRREPIDASRGATSDAAPRRGTRRGRRRRGTRRRPGNGGAKRNHSAVRQNAVGKRARHPVRRLRSGGSENRVMAACGECESPSIRTHHNARSFGLRAEVSAGVVRDDGAHDGRRPDHRGDSCSRGVVFVVVVSVAGACTGPESL